MDPRAAEGGVGTADRGAFRFPPVFAGFPCVHKAPDLSLFDTEGHRE